MNEKIKKHFQEHKVIYISAGLTAIAGITWVIVRGRYVENPMGSNGLDEVTVRPLAILSKQNIITVISREGRGHPGYIVQCLETGEIFLSQCQAAAAMNIPEKVISHHLTGKISDAAGYHFERVAVAA